MKTVLHGGRFHQRVGPALVVEQFAVWGRRRVLANPTRLVLDRLQPPALGRG